MTVQRILELLEVLVLELGHNTPPPTGVPDWEWAYVKGLAASRVLALRDDLRRNVGAS